MSSTYCQVLPSTVNHFNSKQRLLLLCKCTLEPSNLNEYVSPNRSRLFIVGGTEQWDCFNIVRVRRKKIAAARDLFSVSVNELNKLCTLTL